MSTQSTESTGTILPLAGITAAAISIYFWRLFNVIPKSYKGQPLPPMHPGGFLETGAVMSSERVPYVLYQCAQALHCGVFRLHIPVLPGGFGFIIVGQADVAKELMLDETTTKASALYADFSLVATGRVNIVTATDGHEWYARRKAVRPAFHISESFT